MSDNNEVGCTFPGSFIFLTMIFTGLKLFGVVAWPWLWVLSPLWLPVAAVSAAMVFFVAAALLIILLD